MNKMISEFVGTLFLVVSCIGCGIMAASLTTPGDLGLILGSVGPGLMLFVLITVLGPISGAHMNPAVSLAFFLRGDLKAGELAGFIVAQLLAALAAVILVHAMYELPLMQMSDVEKSGMPLLLSEAFATFGLMFVILGGLRFRPDQVPALVGAYIVAAVMVTSSTSYANPAVTLGRSLSDTMTGIRLADVPLFAVAQIIGAALAVLVARKMFAHSAADDPK